MRVTTKGQVPSQTLRRVRGVATANMSTDDIMALTQVDA